MKLILAALCFVLVFVSYSKEARSESVRVRLLASQEKVLISGSNLRFQNLHQPFRRVAIPTDGKIEVRRILKDGKTAWVLRINDRDPEHLFTDKFVLIQGEGLRMGAQALPSQILLSQSSANKMDVVGLMDLNAYLVGVLASEMPLSWPLETLKAQAVAARSYALAVISDRRDKPYHLESSVLDQVFRHVVTGDEQSPLIEKALRAVRETEGQKLYGANNKVLKAFFHSDCGGKTTTARHVWNHDVDSGVAVDSSCPTSPKAHWELRLSSEELSRRLGASQIIGLDLLKAPSENRVRAVRLALGGTSEKVFTANSFRQLLGYENLRSTVFEIKKEGPNYLFKGQGFGHGVGLCQWGSRSLGKRGLNYRQILAHYYPLAQLK